MPSADEPSRNISETRVKAVASPRLLIVEDHAMLGRLLRDIASELCEAHLATDAHAALALLESKPFDVVLADANLGIAPSGIWLLREVSQRWPHVRRCLMSGDEYRSHAGEYVFFFKPLTVEDLGRVVFGGPAQGTPVRRSL